MASYLIRVSGGNGFKHIGYFLRYAGLGWKNNRAPIHGLLTGKSDLSQTLSQFGLHIRISRIKDTFLTLRKVIDTPYLVASNPKICPDCIEELGYCKYQWSIYPSIACAKHNKNLVDVDHRTGSRLSWYRRELDYFDGSHKKIVSPFEFADPTVINISRYFDSLLAGEKKCSFSPLILHGLELRESLSLIHFVAHFQSRMFGISFNPSGMENSELGQHYKKVWDMLTGWPDSFYLFLSQYIDHPMSNKGVGGLNKHFRDLYEQLHRQRENNGIARIKKDFDHFIDSQWPGLIDPGRMKRIQLSSSSRNIISKKEAAKILGCRLARFDKLIYQSKLKVVLFKGKAHYFRDQVEQYSELIKSNWTMIEACEALQLSRYQLKQLLDGGIIGTLQVPSDLNRDWVIDKDQCKVFITKLLSGARNTSPSKDGLSLAGIHRNGFSIVQLVLAMQSGQVEYSTLPNPEYPLSFKQFTNFSVC
ncbi:hypothetical protein GNX18_16765 [Microbulbifer sp. SH-1]|nr:hypothetical protein GNX18_16765 [Microbulbifer sp. SH-1]